MMSRSIDPAVPSIHRIRAIQSDFLFDWMVRNQDRLSAIELVYWLRLSSKLEFGKDLAPDEHLPTEVQEAVASYLEPVASRNHSMLAQLVQVLDEFMHPHPIVALVA